MGGEIRVHYESVGMAIAELESIRSSILQIKESLQLDMPRSAGGSKDSLKDLASQVSAFADALEIEVESAREWLILAKGEISAADAEAAVGIGAVRAASVAAQPAKLSD